MHERFHKEYILYRHIKKYKIKHDEYIDNILIIYIGIYNDIIFKNETTWTPTSGLEWRKETRPSIT